MSKLIIFASIVGCILVTVLFIISQLTPIQAIVVIVVILGINRIYFIFTTTYINKNDEVDLPSKKLTDYEIKKIRARNRDFIRTFGSDVIKKYKDDIATLLPILAESGGNNTPNVFGKFGQCKGDNTLFIGTNIGIYTKKDKQARFSIVFSLDAGSPKLGNIPLISHFIDGYSSLVNLFGRQDLQTLFPKMGNPTEQRVKEFEFTEEEMSLFYQEFPELTPQALSEEEQRVEFENTFRTEAFTILDKLFPKLVELHQNGEL